jgi:GTP-binding protein
LNTFVDDAVIEVTSGKGGNGCAAFRREKYVPKGGPAGGDGGKGGNVVFAVRQNVRTLYHLRRTPVYRAENGRDGEGAQRFGKNGADLVIPVPPGTVLRDAVSDAVIHDFAKDKSDFLFLKGGNGGWGNVHFKSSINQAPKKALPGKEGETRKLRVVLEIIADIGFVGFPNAGKSSLLDRLTNARPKIAPYPFTTKIPNLGVFTVADTERRDIILADIPGLIEGAHTGAGLGIEFLKHISRTSALAFLIDLSDDNYLTAFSTLQAELKAFSRDLLKKKRVILGTKQDVEGAETRLAELQKLFPQEKVLGISVFSGVGLDAVREAFTGMVFES